MGRLIRRVPENFSYPLHAIWVGYINPYCGFKCPVCDGDGRSEQAKQYHKDWYGWDTKSERTANGGYWYPQSHQYHLEQYEVDALWADGRPYGFNEKPTVEQVNEWAHSSTFGHDSLNQYLCERAHAEKHGYDPACPYCHGEGYIRDVDAFENWKSYDPPTGDWYQLWEDTSEGSPITPAFATPEELASYCVENNVHIFAHDTMTYDEWLKFILNNDPLLYTVDGVGEILIR